MALPGVKLRIGDLAQRSGLSVRTLRHYDALGLLTTQRSESGQRLYSEQDVMKLWQVQSLKALGLPLADIRAALADPAHNPAALLWRASGNCGSD